MPRILPRRLRHAAGFIKLRKASVAAGTTSQGNLCHVSCDASKLRVCCTDNRFAFINEFATDTGASPPWSMIVQAREIDCLWMRLKSLGSLNQSETTVN